MIRAIPSALLVFSIIISITKHVYAYNNTITECGESVGQAYYPQSALIPAKEAGWREDKISDGKIILNFDGKEYDLLIKSRAGFKSATKDGALIVKINSEGPLLISAIYPNLVEAYLFNINSAGDGEVIWSKNRSGDFIPPNVAMYHASCTASK